MENPWNIQSIYEFLYFNCPSCVFKISSKQEFIDHAYEIHPESIEYLTKINDNSLSGVTCPWNEVIYTKIKIEPEDKLYNTESIDNQALYEVKTEQLDDNLTEFKFKEQVEIDALEGIQDPLKQSINKNEEINYNDLQPLNSVNKRVRNHNCETCGKCFISKKDLSRHIAAVHEGVKSHKCETCGKCYNRNFDLQNHIKIIHENIKAFKCETCGRSFGHLKSLKVHIRSVHEEDRNHKCETCGKAFSDRSNLVKHMNALHEGVRHQCVTCNKFFSHKHNLEVIPAHLLLYMEYVLYFKIYSAATVALYHYLLPLYFCIDYRCSNELVKYYNDLLGKQSSGRCRDEVTYFYVGTFFAFTLALSMPIFKRNFSGKKSLNITFSNFTTM